MGELVLKRLTKRFGDVVAVDDVSLKIEDGEFLVLLGPSGCGKSTILRLVAGLEDATAGEIVIGDQLVNFVDPVQRNVAMVFQSYALYPHMTVFKNIAFPLQMAKKPRSEIESAVRRAAETLELAELLGRHPDQLSGGQRQRVALARAIVREPAAFLMDEPLSNLDALLRVQTRIELMRLHERLGTTTAYVTHDQVEAMTMGHRIAVMERGVLQQVGTPDDVYNRPANTFVATFIGSPPMNLVRGAVVPEGAGLAFQGSDVSLSFDQKTITASGDGLDRAVGVGLHLGIRPEDLALVGPEQGVIHGVVQILEPVGSDLYLTVEAAGTTIQVRVAPDAAVRAGERVSLAFQPEKSHLFAADGRNVRYAPDDVPASESAIDREIARVASEH